VIVKIIHFFNLSATRFKKISNLVYVDPYAHCVPLNIHTAGIPHLSYLGIKVLAPWAQLKASAPTKARHNSKIKACANGCSQANNDEWILSVHIAGFHIDHFNVVSVTTTLLLS